MSNFLNKAFVFIACGPYARTYKPEMAIESLVKAGWRGRVYLITDSPRCFNIDKLKTDAGSDLIQLITVPVFSDRFDTFIGVGKKFPFIGLKPARTVIESKILKASFFDYISDPQVEIGLYCDADVIFSRPDHLEEILTIADDWSGTQGIKTRIKDDSWVEGDQNPHHFHTGFIMAHRYHSAKIMKRWQQIMSDPKNWVGDPYDRTKFMQAFQLEGQEADLKFYPLNRRVEQVYNFKSDPAFAAHITIARILNASPNVVQNFIGSLSLRSCTAEQYAMPKMPRWKRYLFYLGYFPYRSDQKLEDR